MAVKETTKGSMLKFIPETGHESLRPAAVGAWARTRERMSGYVFRFFKALFKLEDVIFLVRMR